MSDWLSPILVKELRQGMRARVFETVFILQQVLMVLAISVAVMVVASKQGGDTATVAEVLFWAMIAIPVLLVMPLRGSAALRSEIDSKTLELIFLTRLSAWRIVFGKWAALFSQTLLMVVAVLPYVVLRYYMGSVDVVGDLAAITSMLGVSALLTAVTVTGSAFPSKLARGLVILLPLFLLYVVPVLGSVFMMSSRGTGVGSSLASVPGLTYVGVVFYGVVTLLFLLEVGASRIAPPAENHALRKRFLGLLIILSGLVALLFGADEELLFLNMIIVIPVLVDALCAPYRPLPGHYHALRRLGPARKVTGPLLLPGWPSGFLYTMLIFIVSVSLLAVTGQFDEMEVIMGCIAGLGALLFPLALVLLIRPQTARLGMFYMAVRLGIIIFAAVISFLCALFNWDILPILSVFPLATLIMVAFDQADSFWLIPTLVVTVSALVVIVKRFLQVRSTGQAARAARTSRPGENRP